MSEAIAAARKLIEARLDEVKTEAASLERALVALGKNSRAQAKPPRRRPAKRPRRLAAKRAAPGERQAQLLAAIKASPGAGAAELAKQIGVKAPQLHGLLRKARTKKLFSRAARATSWRPAEPIDAPVGSAGEGRLAATVNSPSRPTAIMALAATPSTP